MEKEEEEEEDQKKLNLVNPTISYLVIGSNLLHKGGGAEKD